MFTNKFLGTAFPILALSLSSAHGLLKGSNMRTETSMETKGRNLVEQTFGSCDTDTTVKAIGQNDCGIELSRVNGYDDSRVILNEDMRCTPEDDTESAIAITASRITLDCQGHKIEEASGRLFGFGLVLEGDNIVVRNCDISGFNNGIIILSSNSIVLENVNSNNNFRDGLKSRSNEDENSISSLTILSSKFDNNFRGIVFFAFVSNLFVFNVTANNNFIDGFVFRETISTAKFVDVEASNNQYEGIDAFSNSNTKLVLHNNTYCGNAGQSRFSENRDIGIANLDIGSFMHHAITCSKDGDNEICDCQC